MKSLDVSIRVLDKVAEYTDNRTLPLQQIMILLHVANVSEAMPMADLVQLTGVEQSSVSRNVALLGSGLPIERKKGYGLVEAYEDPMYRRRKLVALTPRGQMLQKDLATILR